jgi:putative nucleotidyltransferase with HDIG domain
MRSDLDLRSDFMTPTAEDPFGVLLNELATARPAVYRHCQRVAALAYEIAGACASLDTPPFEIERAALAHDIGKLAIPRGVLHKPAPLTRIERELVRTHPIIGATLLIATPDSDIVARLVRAHHERLDGTGYPSGLRGHCLPIGAQIIALSDTWDAMTHPRPYREAMPFDQAVGELRTHQESQWRRDLVQLTLDICRDRSPNAGSETRNRLSERHFGDARSSKAGIATRAWT